MQCPFCHSEVDAGEIACPSCRAMRITSASPAGVILGWVGVLAAVCTLCLWSAVATLPLMGISLSGFPWAALAAGTALSVGLLWFSRSTREPRWIRR